MSERLYSYDDAFAAMCLWEEVCDPQLPDAGAPWEAYRETWGANGLRDAILTKLANECDQAWNRTSERHDSAHHTWANECAEIKELARDRGGTPVFPDAPKDPGAFDWEFVPTWIRLNVDWSDMQEGPRVRGSAT